MRGDEAERIGLVNRALPTGDEALAAAHAWARAVATEVSPSAVAVTKAQLWADLRGPMGRAVARSERLIDEAMGGADYREGVAAWTERRPPAFGDVGPGPGPRLDDA